jgi:hypothetical protein
VIFFDRVVIFQLLSPNSKSTIHYRKGGFTPKSIFLKAFPMTTFEIFLGRHGEVAAQALVENLERYEGVRTNVVTPLEQRWERLMQRWPQTQKAAA